jgi:hypothetical protein
MVSLSIILRFLLLSPALRVTSEEIAFAFLLEKPRWQ